MYYILYSVPYAASAAFVVIISPSKEILVIVSLFHVQF